MKKYIFSIFATLLIQTTVFALPNINAVPTRGTTGLHKTAAGCTPTTQAISLDINNVRARLMNGGDMWWNRATGVAAYAVPKASNNKNSLFAGSLWIGGYEGGVLKVAAQTYRQSGNDFWSGPLDKDNGANINQQACNDWDKFWKINAADVSTFRQIYAGETDSNEIFAKIQGAVVSNTIKDWPAQGNDLYAKSASGGSLSIYNRDMAPFVDLNNNNKYEWEKGDYPNIVGDQYIWWVFNDKGDAKTETTSLPIGLEIQVGAFAFATNDCLNESTFYNYKVTNFNTSDLSLVTMATWTDADLGNAADDYVGCDTVRGLGIMYNGDAFDDGTGGYGSEIPMVGVDFFQGPRVEVSPGVYDTLSMSSFTYYNNDGTPNGNPSQLQHFYNYMTGRWKDNTPFSGPPSCNAISSGSATNFIFYGDPCKAGTWSEPSCNNVANDRRFIHSAGPFTLKSGDAPNNVIIGAVWVPNVGGGSSACFAKIQACDDKAQYLFDSEFKLNFGPQAPDATVQGLNKKIIFDLTNNPYSNNYKEGYGTIDNANNKTSLEKSVKAVANGSDDVYYKFQGYVVYQLKNRDVTASDVRKKDGSINTDKARIVFQCDLKDGVKEIYNYEQYTEGSVTNYVPFLMATGADKGITHSFELKQDAFSSLSIKDLVNYKTYYYLVVAYGYNRFKPFDESKPYETQTQEYIESRTNGRELPIQVIAAMPQPATDSLYTQTYADYGSGVQLKRIEGIGNGGIAMELTDATEQAMLNGPDYAVLQPEYKPGLGPVNIKVINPDSIKAGEYEILLRVGSAWTGNANLSKGAIDSTTYWVIRNMSTGDSIYSERNIKGLNEQILRKYDANGKLQFDWGMSASVQQQIRPGDRNLSAENGFVTSRTIFADNNYPWLSGITDEDGNSFNNWIKAGDVYKSGTDLFLGCGMGDYDNVQDQNTGATIVKNPDGTGTFEKVINGTFAPYNLASGERKDECGFGVIYNVNDRGVTQDKNRLQDVNSIDIVFTADKSKWTKCAVIEMADNVLNNTTAEGGAFKFNVRKHAAWNKEYNSDGSPKYLDNTNNPANTGWSWFPGYATNIETGERLAMMFGEESFNGQDNAKDMIWNPTSTTFDFNTGQVKWGGKHVIYVSRSNYKNTETIISDLQSVSGTSGSNGAGVTIMKTIFKEMMWVGIPLLKEGFKFKSLNEGIIPNETRLQMRVTRPYDKYVADAAHANQDWPHYTFSTRGIAPALITDDRNTYKDNKKELLKQIFVVPNPYYAYSENEINRLDNRVRIVNLPEKAIIKIYSLDGSLVRTITKSDKKTNYVDWDIKNQQNIPIASGMYLIHVQLEGIGETIVKWFGAMRPTDLTSF
jgi:hypothetical protein